MADSEQALTCALCLEIYTKPKLLPCHHTFCQHCLEDLASRHPGGKFPCPACRADTRVPSGGVSAFQTNFYINPVDLEKARDGSMCPKHPKQDLDLFCVDCVLPICLKCKLTKHEGHETQDISEAATEVKKTFDEEKDGLKKNLEYFQSKTDTLRKEQQAVRDKRAALAANIRNRQAVLKAAADKYAEDALTSLDKVTKDIWDNLQTVLNPVQENHRKLSTLMLRMQQAVDSGSALQMVKAGLDFRDYEENKTSEKIMTGQRPLLHFSTTPSDVVLQHIQTYIGRVVEREMDLSDCKVTVQEKFRCRQDPDTDVFGLCPLTNGSVFVSYEPYMSCNLASEKFNAKGESVHTMKCDTRGRNTMVRRKNGLAMHITSTKGSVCTYAKKCDSHMIRFFRLHHNTPGKGTVSAVKTVSDKPFKTEVTNLFTINCAAQRAFDLDSKEQLVVVLEDGKAPDYQRQVQLYRCFQPDPIATYCPPVNPCQPSDVCFYKKGDREVLLVADELNDTIHVVDVQSGRLSFERYLAPGCPLLVQPTALNTDTENRLWVACRGGRILTVQDITENTL